MSNPFDQFDNSGTSAANPFDQFDSTPQGKKQNKGIAGDLVTDLKRGVEQLPGIVTGVADIPIAAITGDTYADKAANALGGITGFAPAKWAKDAEAEYSPGRVAAKSNVDQAWEDNKTPFADAAGGDFAGIGQIAKSYVQNPQQLVGSVVESLPSMLGGAKIGQALTKAVGIAAPVVAGAVGEGAVMAGQQMNNLTEAGADPRTAAAASAVTGVVGGAVGAVGGKLAQRMGVVDPDTALAGGATRALAGETGDQTIKGTIKEGAKRIAGGAASEGLFEELPQSVLEQVLSNLAQGKPWEEGVGRSAVEGTLAGSLMGGAFNALPGKKEAPATTPPENEQPTIAGLLPAPTYTGTPGEQIIAADAERQAAIDAADTANQKLWEERDAYAKLQEELKRNNITIINDPEPLQQRIDALMGINEARLQGFASTNYEKAIDNAFGEQVGIVVGKDGLEVPFTMGDYLKSKIAVGDMARKDQGKKAPSAGIAAAPVIPVVGPLSAVANMAVQSGAHQATVMQQAAAQAPAASPKQGPLAEVAAQAPNISNETTPVAPNIGAKSGADQLSRFSDLALQQAGEVGVAGDLLEQHMPPADWKILKDAGLLVTKTLEDGTTYQTANMDALYAERERRYKAERGGAKAASNEERNAGIENRARNYDRIAKEQDDLGELGDQAKAAEHRAKAAEIRSRKTSAEGKTSTAKPAQATPAKPAPAGDDFINSRTDAQLNWLAERGKPEFKAAAAAEIQARAGQVSVAPEMPNGDGVTDQPTDTGIPMSVANQEPIKNASPTAAMVPAEPVVQNQEPIKSAEQPASADPALQNRDRGRAASVNQMQSIARSPDYMRLGPSRTPDSGAPMVFAVGGDTNKISPASMGGADIAVMADGQRVPFRYAVVDARSVEPSNFADGATNPAFSSDTPGTIKALNNGRTAGVRAAHEGNTAANYTAELLADQAHGVSPAAIRNTPNPMLVRVYAEQANTGDMAAKSQGQGLGMSASERATQDAELMTSDVLDKFAPGDIASAGNRDFVRAFVGKLAENELADMMDATGNLSQDGRRRIEAALLTAAYGKSDLVQELFESTDTDIKAIGNALKVMSGQWAAMRQAAKEGSIDPATDMTANLIEAVNIVRRSRAEGSSIAELAGQGDLMGGNYLNELSELFLRIFYKGKNYDRARGGDKVISALQEIVTSAMNTKAEAGLFGDSFKATPKHIVESARSKIDEENKPASQSSLFGANGQATAVSQGNRSESAQKPGEVGSRPVSPGRGEEAGKQAEPVAKAAEPAPAVDSKQSNDADLESRIMIAADSIDKLRKVDVERVLMQGNIDRQKMADYIKRKRPEFSDEVDSVIEDATVEDNQKSEALDREMAGFTGVNDAEYELRQLSRKEKRDGDIELGNGKFVTLEQAVAAAKMSMDPADWIKPFQFNHQLDIAPIDWNTMVGAMKNATVNAKKQEEAKPVAPTSEMDALKAEMGQAIGELASILGAKQNLTPEEESRIIPVMSKIFRIAAKMGYIKFKDAAKYVLDQIRQLAGADVADKISIDNLQAGYINIAKEIGGDKREAMTYDSIEDLEKANVTDERSGADLESDSGNAGTENGLGEEGVRAGRDGDGGTGRPGIQGSEESLRAGSGSELRGPEAVATGERGNLEIYTGATELSPGSAGSSVDSGSRDSGLAGAPIEPDAAKATRQSATGPNDLKAKVLEQAKADKNSSHKEGIEAIRAALPILTENQQDDVAKAEVRFAVPDGYGMLFTNGTGTGKTFTGLGVIKRFANQGKKNILIVAPNDKIIEDWQKSGALLGLDLSRLADTNDAGKGIVITTYANMGQNNALAKRDWDLVVHDEAHYLAMDKDGTNTNALKNLRAVSLHPGGVFQRHSMINADDIQRLAELDADAKMQRMSDDQRMWVLAEKTQADADKLRNELKAKQEAIKEDVTGRQGAKRTRALFLSATPFAYEKTVDWANGYIFDYNEGRGDESREFRGYNTGSNSDQFMMQHFGYRMRYGKLTQPDSKVDSGLMQRQFNTWLKKKGSLSGRMLDVAADYDRKFILVDSAIGQRIDAALEWFEVKRKAQHEGMGEAGERIGAIMAKADPYASALSAVRDHIGEKFDYLSRRYLLESIKAREVVPHIREHLALGRKIVVFHDYKKGGGFNPFILDERSVKAQEAEDGTVQAAEWNKVVREFNAEFRDIINSDLFKQSSPIDMFKQEFPDVLLFNGDVPQKQRRANVAKFQDDASGPQVILVQSAAGKEGISLHDTTGKHQRVLFNLGQPTQPTTAIQQEGRIYRTGQVTDALFRYLNTGTNWEKWAFATTIAQRASAAENLGMGEQARALKDAFISGFEESGDYRAGMENEGKGGKERDKAANDAMTEYDRARAFYFGTQKKTSKTKAQEGADYFATPEPVGLKMVEWADIRPGEKVLEPSAGHGAIARWIPNTAERTAIEPSMALRPRLAMVFDGQIIDTDFESMNVVNKFDAIVMNPPFGSGGKTAVDHLAKAATHLRDGGRIVALLPTGPAADKKFDKWMYGEEERAVKPIYEHPALGPIYRGDTIETNASWMKEGVITRKDKEGNLWFKREGATGESAVAYQAFKSVKPTGQRKAMFRPTEGLYTIADIKMPAITFERAGAQVMTRIVVIEKSSDPKAIDTRGVYNRDFTNAEDINDLFDRLEDMALPNRAKEYEQEEEEAPKPGRKAKPVVDTVATQAAAEKAGLEIIEHTTGKGKVLRGVVRTDLTQAQAKEIDEFTFKKDGGWFIREKHLVEQSGPGNVATPSKISPADKAIYGMAAEGKSAAEILKFIASASRNPFYRQLAKLLQKTGIAPSVTVGDGKGWKFNAGEGNKYAAGYNPKSDTISLFRPASAERNMLHELVHAATLKALSGKGMAAAQMNALYQHVKKTGKLNGMYGMANLDEFVAEVFSNPKFQAMLKQVSAAPVGGKPSSAWDWFIRVVRGVLGLKQGQDNALSQALDIGVGVMRENMRLNDAPKNDNVRGVPDNTTASGRGNNAPAPEADIGEAITLYTGSAESISEIKNRGAYGGLFASASKDSALSHGKVLHEISLNKSDVMTQSDIENISDNELLKAAHWVSKDDVDRLRELVVDDEKAKDTDADMLRVEDAAEASIEGQRLRGVIAKSLGFKAVEMNDEHGTSYLVLPGAKIKPNKPSASAGSDADVRYNAAPGKINQTDTEAFKRWFGDSKVVDSDGKPLVVYHGSGNLPASFSADQRPERYGMDKGSVAFFTENPRTAASYANNRAAYLTTKTDGKRGVLYDGAAVAPVYLSFQNPLVVDAQVANFTAVPFEGIKRNRPSVEGIAKIARERGHDGLIVHNVKDNAPGVNTTATTYVAFEPTQIKSAIGNNGDFSPSNPDIRYNVADEGWSVSEQAKETVMRLAGRPMLDPSDPFAAENARLREQDQSLWSKAKKQLRRYLAPGGLLPQSVFAEKIKRDSEFQAVEFDVRHLIGGLEHAVKADFGMAFDKLSKEQMRPITEALAGNVPASLPEATKTAAVAMRQYIDGMSTEYLKIIQQKIDAKMLKALESGKDADKAQAINEIELFEKIKGNIGRYVHRSYQAFDDPKWFEKVPASTLNASRLYLKQGYMEAGETDAKAAQMAEVTLHEILKNGTAYDSMESFIAESKLGAKDLSVLMRRKEVPPQIRALLGEYPDARLNFTKSATKMGRLIWNTRFLDRVRDMGMGSFFFEGKDRPPNATTQIAADGSEVYAPLNGLWTFPETAQAFKDALGKEQMSDLYRAIVRANGLVKYGKTVLAPTTAMRNWQSAMFFSLANGHFDLTQMKKSISAFREQVSQTATSGDLKYLRHLKQLGVVYDTPYAGEMARLMEDARMEELLSSDKGDAVRWFRKVNQLAQGFYTFGDDFWKIIGFENEKAGLMKAGLSLQEAEIEAAKRIRDTYPTYSMVGRGVQWLSRFPLAGTFVSFPAEIIRTSANMLRTVAADLKSDNPKLRELGMKRAAGMVFVSAAFYSLAALSMAMAGVGDDEDEAIRDLAPEWQKNSTFLYLGRDEKGSLRYFDMSFLDPYGYWKRPITAMLRNQPWEDSLASGLRGMLEPFLGADISAKAIFEAVANKKESGSKVYKEKDGAIDQAVDIADHLRKALQPGVIGNVERLVKASADVRKSSGQPYSMEDELVALAGWRATTIEPKTALYYRSFEFTDSLAEARKTLTDTLRDANEVSPEDIKDARERAKSKQEQAFKEMSRLVGAAEAAGMSKMQIVQTLRLSNISQANIASLMRGATPDVSITPQLAARAVRQASQMRGPEFAADVFDRYRQAMAK